MDAAVVTPWTVIGGLLVIAAVFGGFGFLMLKAASYPQPTLIVIATSVLTTLALLGYAFQPEAGEFAAIAAAGIGALAGSVSAMFGRRGDDEEP